MSNQNSTTVTGGLQAFLDAIAQVESGGNYHAKNPGGALGKYQVMPGNVASWTKRALGHSETPSQFLNDPAAQEAVARTILGAYYNQYGPEGAASMWFSGQPNPNSKASDGSNTVPQYVAKVMKFFRGGAGGTTPTTPTGATPAQPAGFDPTGVGGAISSFAETVKNLAIISPFIAAGVVLVVLGLGHATGANAKVRDKFSEAKQNAKQAAVMAAMA